MGTLRITVWARDEATEALLREKVRALKGVTLAPKAAPKIHGAVVDTHLLTPGEVRILQAFRQHDRIEQVAKSLRLSRNTVKKHLSMIYFKLEVHSLHRALVRAIEWGLLQEDYPIG